MEREKIIRLAIVFIAIFTVGISAQQFFNLNTQNLDSWIKSFKILAPAIYSVMLVFGLSIPFNPIPDYLLVNLAAYLFNPIQAIVATFFAHTVAISINYYLAKKFGPNLLKKVLINKEEQNISIFSVQITPVRIFSMRWILPLTAIGVDIVSYASGIARISFTKFFVASIIPWTILNIIFFTSTSYLKQISAGLILVPGIILAVMSLSIYYLAQKINQP